MAKKSKENTSENNTRDVSNPFTWLETINVSKVDLIKTSDDPTSSEKAYLPFMVNRGLSYFPDTIMYANEMNCNPQLPNKLQYDYLMTTIRKRKRFSKWHKAEKDEVIEVIQNVYKYNKSRAEEVYDLLSPEQIQVLKDKMITGDDKT